MKYLFDTKGERHIFNVMLNLSRFKDFYISQQTWNQTNFPSGYEINVNDFNNEAEYFYIS